MINLLYFFLQVARFCKKDYSSRLITLQNLFKCKSKISQYSKTVVGSRSLFSGLLEANHLHCYVSAPSVWEFILSIRFPSSLTECPLPPSPQCTGPFILIRLLTPFLPPSWLGKKGKELCILFFYFFFVQTL